MLFNPFTLKKYAALVLCASVPTVMFFIAFTFYNLIWGLAFFLLGTLLSVILGNLFLDNPFRTMLEGRGLLAVNLDSTGIFRFFNIGLQNPYVSGKFNKQKITDIFDRAAVMQVSPPIQNSLPAMENKKGELVIKLDQNKFNEARFAMLHYPVLIWNDQIKSLLTKDFFSTREKDAYAEHGVLYLNKQVEDLNMNLRNFGRYVVEQLKPQGNFWQNKWVWVIIAIAIVVAILLAFPIVSKFITTLQEPAASALDKATGAITPK